MNNLLRLLKQSLTISILFFAHNSASYSDQNDLMNFSVEDLLNVEVISVAKDAYRSSLNQSTTLPQLTAPYLNNFNETIDTFGGNLVARHQHTFSSTSDYTLQVFYDFL